MSDNIATHHRGDPVVPGNWLLAALPPEDLDRLRAYLTPVSLTAGALLHEPGAPLTHAYFPAAGIISLLTILGDGTAIEAATVGREGLVGLAAFLGAAASPRRAVVVVPGAALRLPVAMFRALAAPGCALHDALHRYAGVRLVHVAQVAACNGAHTVPRRCVSRLLLLHDRVAGDTIPLTHAALARMLGVRRATVTEIAGRLQWAGLIRYHHGVIAIVDRAGLESSSCECYGVVRREFSRLMG